MQSLPGESWLGERAGEKNWAELSEPAEKFEFAGFGEMGLLSSGVESRSMSTS